MKSCFAFTCLLFVILGCHVLYSISARNSTKSRQKSSCLIDALIAAAGVKRERPLQSHVFPAAQCHHGVVSC